jgi:hypothetical protein
MSQSTCLRRLFKEIGRFPARDEKGNHHTVVERVRVNERTDANGRIVSSRQGASHFYSATTGDALVKRADGNLTDQNNLYCIILNFSNLALDVK